MKIREVLYLVAGFVQAGATFGSYAWTVDDGTRYWLSIGVLAMAVFGWPIELFRISRKSRADRTKMDVRAALHAALVKITQSSKVPADQIGLHAYWVKRRWRLTGKRVFQHHQQRIGRLRFRADLPESTITWTKGKGVIGRCWEEPGRIHPVFLSETHRDLKGCDVATWEAASEERKMNFTYSEWRTASRYAGIVAAPIVDANEEDYLGCISIDCVDPEDYVKIRNNRKAVDNALLDTAKLVRLACKGE